jgi:hypothetical protein
MKSLLRLFVLPVVVAIFAAPAVARDYDHCARGGYGQRTYGPYFPGYAPAIVHCHFQIPHYGHFDYGRGYVYYSWPIRHGGYYQDIRIHRPPYEYGCLTDRLKVYCPGTAATRGTV